MYLICFWQINKTKGIFKVRIYLSKAFSEPNLASGHTHFWLTSAYFYENTLYIEQKGRYKKFYSTETQETSALQNQQKLLSFRN